jgi:AcrR family transcriptional regulator
MSNSQIKNKVLDAAIGLLADKGEGFTMQQLEARVLISRASIYRHVGGKEEILTLLRDEHRVAVEKTDISTQILQAARREFSRNGLRGTTMEQIASEAGVGVATVYRHFGDKKTLMMAFIAQAGARNILLEIMMNPTEDVTADLRSLVENLLQVTHDNRDIFRLVMAGSEQDQQYLDELRKNTDSTLVRLTAYFEAQLAAERLKSLATGEELALALMGMVINFSVLGPLHYGRKFEDAEATGELIVNIFLNSLQGKQS